MSLSGFFKLRINMGVDVIMGVSMGSVMTSVSMGSTTVITFLLQSFLISLPTVLERRCLVVRMSVMIVAVLRVGAKNEGS
jgi:hypothetical protein